MADYIPVSGTVTNVNFADSQTSIGDVISRITLQTTIDAQTAKVIKATLIKADDSEQSCDISVFWGCTITSEATPKPTAIKRVMIDKSDAADNAIYNLNGQRITNPQKGIYIQNGKKYIAK